jgi:DNA (cytosine-5)-methyltransferase 1
MSFIEFCSGGGGLSLGLIKAGLKPLLLNDNNKLCCQTLKLNHPHVQVINSDMNDLIKSDILTPYKNVDLICSGIPCQSYSVIGAKRGLDDARGNLMLVFSQILNTVKPKMFLVENVKGLLLHNKGATLKIILDDWKAQGYTIQYGVLNSYDYTVPQKRERIIIVGIRNKYVDKYKSDDNLFEFPDINTNRVVISDAISDLEDLSPEENPSMKYNDKKTKLFEMIPEGGCWVNLPEDLQKEYLGKTYYSGGGKRGILRRLNRNKPCNTLLCSPINKQTEFCHYKHIRPLSVKEYARIQTFPDDYKFCGSINQQYKQIGNAVPVKMAEYIGKSILDTLDKINNM